MKAKPTMNKNDTCINWLFINFIETHLYVSESFTRSLVMGNLALAVGSVFASPLLEIATNSDFFFNHQVGVECPTNQVAFIFEQNHDS